MSILILQQIGDLFRFPSWHIRAESQNTTIPGKEEPHITNDAIYLFPVVSKVMCSAIHKLVSQSVIMDLCYSTHLSHSWHLSFTQGFTLYSWESGNPGFLLCFFQCMMSNIHIKIFFLLDCSKIHPYFARTWEWKHTLLQNKFRDMFLLSIFKWKWASILGGL